MTPTPLLSLHRHVPLLMGALCFLKAILLPINLEELRGRGRGTGGVAAEEEERLTCLTRGMTHAENGQGIHSGVVICCSRLSERLRLACISHFVLANTHLVGTAF